MLLYIQHIRESINLSEDWLIGLFVIQLLILSWLSYNYPKGVIRLFTMLTNREVEKQDFSEKMMWTNTFSLAFMSVFIISVSWFLYLVLNYYGLITAEGGNRILIYILIVLGMMLLYLLKLLILNIINGLTPNDYGIALYSYSVGQYHHITGILLFPLVVFKTFSPSFEFQSFLIIGLIIYGAIYFLRLLRGMLNSYETEAQPFYLILYLCTFEFLPILLTVKYFVSWFSID